MLISGCTSIFSDNLLIIHRAVSLLLIFNRFETSLFTGKTSVFHLLDKELFHLPS